MRKETWLYVAVGLALTGCAAPSQQQVEADVANTTRESLPQISEAWNAASNAGDVESGWVSSFDDPLLESLVVEALARNQDLVVAAANVEQAQALARQAGASLAPNVSLNLGGTRAGTINSDTGSAANSFNGGLQVGWEADLWGRIRSGTAQASASAQAAQADYLFAQYSLAANTAIAYFTAVEAGLQTQIAIDSLDALEKTHRIVQAQYAEGMASAQDVALSSSDLAAANDQVEALRGAQGTSLRSLELLLGRYPGADINVGQVLPLVPPAPPAGVPADILERRPDLIAAERQVAAAFNATNQAKAARLPSVSLTGSLGGASSELSSLLDPGNVAWSAGTSLLAPLFDGGTRRENVVIATAQQEAAVARYSSAALRAFSDVESALAQGSVLAAREDALQVAADQAAEAYRLAELQYQEGETSLIELLAVQQRVNGTRSSLSSVRRLLLQQRVNLNLALGGNWED